MAKASPRNPSARKPISAKQKQFKRKVAAMVKGGREVAAKRVGDRVAKKANARSIAKVGHRMVGVAAARAKAPSIISTRQAIKSAAPKAALRSFEHQQARRVKAARVQEKLAGRPHRQAMRSAYKFVQAQDRQAAASRTAHAAHLLKNVRPQRQAARIARQATAAAVHRPSKLGSIRGALPAARRAARVKAMAPHAMQHVKSTLAASSARSALQAAAKRNSGKVRIASVKAPPVANRPIPLQKRGFLGAGLKTNLLKSRGTGAAVKIGAKIKARKLGRTLAKKGSAAFHAPANFTSKLGAKAASAVAGKRLLARLKG